ncbi:MAG: putative toxin-antitoxin system toxin component, PIN family [Comamonadaceae bacterium]|nr:MAG: putative toxin-antitoxin system toxin component, PIN family [Comamonadaceae bacterium]
MQTLVLDTNIVLDLFVFADARARALSEHLERGGADWLATAAMRDELERVLAYAHIESRLEFYRLQAGEVLTRFDRHARIVEAPPKAPVTCKDPDDQKFIDLAVAHRSMLLSKDAAVLAMTKRLVLLDVIAAPVMPG